jgi:DNA-binding NarL/FixJ family response regulator
MLEMVLTVRPEIILLDAAFPEAMAMARGLHAAAPASQIVVIAITETEENVLAWAEAGVAGYVPNTASLQELTTLLRQINRGEQSCSSRISGTLLRRIGSVARSNAPETLHAASLTSREVEIVNLIGAGLSNKDIARRLGISVGTTKSHVHSVLGKMKLTRRAEVVVRFHRSVVSGDLVGAQPQGYRSENHR